MTDRATYAEYLRRLDVRAVLEHYNAENCTEMRNRDGSVEILHSCLLDRVEPHHANGDQNPSASANVEHKTYICYSYMGCSIPQLIARLERQPLSRVPLMGQFLSGATTDSKTFLAEVEQMMARATPASVPLPAYSERVLRPWAYIHPYLSSRGVSDDTASALHIGWDQESNRITIPHFWEGHLVGWQRRSIPPGDWPATVEQHPKYKSSPGFPKSTTLYHLDPNRRADHLIVVESPLSVIKAHSLGITNVVATWGAKISDEQIRLLRSFPRVTVWMDPDPAGFSAEQKLVRGLWDHVHVRVAHSPEGSDLADCQTAGDVHQKIEEAEMGALALARYERGGGGRGRTRAG